ncbi:MAG: DUF72 domain-containing protein [Desulfohalobiaceae bacterium]|nr:DUF72 domain-containing protein [Desulfohalobiaceae bacterium]
MSNSAAAERRLFIGTSGWNYKNWKEDFYQGVPQKRWLQHYAAQFDSVEVNATFYRQLKEDTYRKWMRETPESFFFAIKGTRFVTHVKRLKDPEESVLKQRDNVAPLFPRLCAVIWQLPATLQKDADRLRDFARALSRNWSRTPHAVEFRHDSWFDEEVARILAEHDLANCLSDAPDWPMWDRVTSDLAYVRLHGQTELYRSEYSEKDLARWAAQARDWLDQGKTVSIYFDNTDGNHAFRNALRLREMLS